MDWRKIIGSAAPVLGAALGGPAGGAAMTLLASAFGGDPDKPDELAAKIQADPDAAAKLAEIERRHEERLFELSLADRQDARSREVAMAESGNRDVAVPLLAGLVVAGFFVLTGVMMFVELPSGSEGPVNQLFGALAAGFGAVLQYYFGSSVGSKQKDKLMAKR